MKLSTKPRHIAPRMKVRSLSGKLHTRIYFTRSNHPGRYSAKPIVKPGDNEMIIKSESGIIGDPQRVQKEMSLLHRIMHRLRGGK